MKRFAPAYTQLKALIGEGTEQGPVISYACEFGFAAWKPDFTPVEFVTQAVIHLIDLVRDIFGEVVDVSAMKNSVGDGLAIIVQVRHENGVIGSLNFVSARAWSRETEELSVTCANGVVRVSDLSRIQVLNGEVAGTTVGPGEPPRRAVGYVRRLKLSRVRKPQRSLLAWIHRRDEALCWRAAGHRRTQSVGSG
ncbi:hypothetical protein [Salinibacterium sp. M195]|uniref:Gfo/Idh/MocA family protein n=1 Tax=Salinibacterium sp. M195 TaxID=2583374 RepID=UPI001C635B6B|nr:hypothetical protein [Salinibacterium sp. M195]QYH34545.1 hypothetical protein FFT87_00415 [Salinibacterium sp. M195]